MNKEREQIKKIMVELNNSFNKDLEELYIKIDEIKESPDAYYFDIVFNDFHEELYDETFCWSIYQAKKKFKQLGIEYDSTNYDNLEDKLEEILMRDENDCYTSIGELMDDKPTDEIIELINGFKAEWDNVYSLIDINRVKKFKEYNLKELEELADKIMNYKHENRKYIVNKFKGEYLDFIVETAYKRIRAKINKKYSRNNLFDLGDNYSWSKDMGFHVGGRYNLDTNEIQLNENLVTYGNGFACTLRTNNTQKEQTEQLINTMIHEMTHRYLDWRYDDWFCSVDSSPIFMGTLLWLNPNEKNGYKCFEDFKKTETYKMYMECETFREVNRLNNFISKHIVEVMGREMYLTNTALCFNTTTKYNFEEVEDRSIKGFGNCHAIGLDWWKYIVDNDIVNNMNVDTRH